MNKIGIMQGRLSPKVNGRYQSFPIDLWREEFDIAEELGFDYIEFVYDNYIEHPLNTDEGIREIIKCIKRSNVKVTSICADYFMDYPLFTKDKFLRTLNKTKLINLICKASLIGVKDIVIPCVDQSSLKTLCDIWRFRESIHECAKVAMRFNINICLETDLNPLKLHNMIVTFKTNIVYPNITINYDTGNSASLGYNPEEELKIYGHYISLIHIKDRIKYGESVKLGTGHTNFPFIFKKLKEMEYKGNFTLQGSRADKFTDEYKIVEEQLNFLREYINGSNRHSTKLSEVKGDCLL